MTTDPDPTRIKRLASLDLEQSQPEVYDRPVGHHPAGVVMHHAPATGESCLFVIIFHGPFDVIPAP
jgi:hypothetical protein